MATPLIKDNPARTERDGTILAERMAGKTYSDISQSTGVPKTTISRVLNSAEIKARIEAAQQELIDGSLATVISNQLRKIELSRQILTGESMSIDILTDSHFGNLDGRLTVDERKLLNALWRAFNEYDGTDDDMLMVWYPEEWFATAGVPYDDKAASSLPDVMESLCGISYSYEKSNGDGHEWGAISVITEWYWQMNANDTVEEFSVLFGESFRDLMRDGFDKFFTRMMEMAGGCENGATP